MELYDDPVQMEPMLVANSRPAYSGLIGLAASLVEASARLDAAIPQATGKGLAELVSGMNCYYSNLIEGHHTLPIDIEKALLDANGRQQEQQKLHSLARAHIEADHWARRQRLDGATILPFLFELHRRFCDLLPVDLLTLSDGSEMTGGEIRQRDVSVGRHVAPGWQRLDAFLQRFAQCYGLRLDSAQKSGIHRLDAIIAAIAAHHRLVWIHPFPDGNGRVARIFLDAMLRACGLNNAGLWSLSRGFAKTQQAYKTALALADEARHGDLDGRGNLSEKRLVEFSAYALETATDQARFMEGLFALGDFETRCEHYFRNIRLDLKAEAAYLYIAAFRQGELDRMAAGRLTGLPERTARDVLSGLMVEGFIVSDTPRGKVRAGFPMKALATLFPNLYPSGDMDFALPDLSGRRRKR